MQSPSGGAAKPAPESCTPWLEGKAKLVYLDLKLLGRLSMARAF